MPVPELTPSPSPSPDPYGPTDLFAGLTATQFGLAMGATFTGLLGGFVVMTLAVRCYKGYQAWAARREANRLLEEESEREAFTNVVDVIVPSIQGEYLPIGGSTESIYKDIEMQTLLEKRDGGGLMKLGKDGYFELKDQKE